MGIDVQIFIEMAGGKPAPENDSRVEGEFAECEGWVLEEAPFATHELSSMTRYYGQYYQRGPWPDISGLLLFLLMHPDVKGVWYGGDSFAPHKDDVWTLDKLNQMNAFYVANGHEGYGNSGKSGRTNPLSTGKRIQSMMNISVDPAYLTILRQSFAEMDKRLGEALQNSNLLGSEPAKSRVVSKMAKNVQHGEIVDLPHFGEARISAWSHAQDRVHMGDGGQKTASFHPDERVRVRRT